MTLTTTQASARVELLRRGALVASRHAFGPAGRTFSSRTLDALVDAGFARYEVVRGVLGAPAVAVGIVPVGQFWYVNEDGEPYDSWLNSEEQSAEFPNDFHTPFETRAEAQVFADSLDEEEI